MENEEVPGLLIWRSLLLRYDIKVFNDIRGFRGGCDDYQEVLELKSNVFRLVDMSNGKTHDVGIVQKVEPTRTAVDWAEKIRYLVDEIEPNAKKDHSGHGQSEYA